MKRQSRPYALFVLVDLDPKTIDEILGAAIGGYGPALWLATDSYDDAPKKQPRTISDGTKPPIPKDFNSPWVGRRIDDLVHWLKAKPEETDFNSNFFAMLDKGARDDPPTIVICRIGDLECEGDELFLLRLDRTQAVEHLLGAPSDAWNELTHQGKRNAEIDYGEDDA